MQRATRDEVEAYLKRVGKHGEGTLSTLGKLQSFMECFDSELGFELIKSLTERHEELLDRVGELNATDEEKIEFKVVKRLLIELAEKINRYNSRINEIKKVGKVSK